MADLPWLPITLHMSFPQAPAVYFCVDEHNCVQYIGQTKNLKQRFASHHRIDELKELDNVRVHFLLVERDLIPALGQIEVRYVRELEPPLNYRINKVTGVINVCTGLVHYDD